MNCQDHLYRYADPRRVSRRWFFEQCGVGLGAIALGQLLQGEGCAALASPEARAFNPLAARAPHFAPKAKRVLFLFMAGAPSHLELFDHKPQLAKFDGTLPPPELIKGYRAAFIKPSSKLLGPKFKFSKHGQCGTELSEILPHLATVVDDIAVVKGMVTDAFNHAPGQIMMSTGSQIFGRPSLGAWVCYGLGSESQDLPGFIVFSTGHKGPSGGNSNWGSGFLPTVYQGVPFRTSGDPVLYLSNPRGVDFELQRESLDALQKLNHLRLEQTGDPEIATRINSFEMAFRMQLSAPDVMEIGREPQHILDMYGATPGEPSFGNTCLLARRLLERGVRFVQIFHESWDQHDDLVRESRGTARTPTEPAPRSSRTSNSAGCSRRRSWSGAASSAARPWFRGRQRRPRPSPKRLHDVDGGRRRQTGHLLRRERRARLPGGERPSPCARPARDDPAPARVRPYPAYLPIPGPRLPPYRRRRPGRQGTARLIQGRFILANDFGPEPSPALSCARSRRARGVGKLPPMSSISWSRRSRVP